MSQRVAIAALVAALSFSAAACGDATTVDADDFLDVPGLGETRIDVPRPTGSVRAACDDDPLPPSSQESTQERVAGLRSAGLFADDRGLSDEALGTEIDKQLSETWGDSLPVDDPLRDLAVAELDVDRVTWIDLEADVLDGNEVYVTTLKELGRISVGAFEPAEVTETWSSETGPIEVAFDIDGIQHELEPAYLEDWIDPGILTGINTIIADSGRRFELYRAFDQTAFILALTDEERQSLEARGWCFE